MQKQSKLKLITSQYRSLQIKFRKSVSQQTCGIQNLELCRPSLGEYGKNINDDIAQLVKKGLSPVIQKSLDVVRVIGNEAVHPGTIDLKDKPQTAIALFNLVNLIADSMITQPKMVNALYDALPEDKKEHIAKRDK